MKEIVFIKKFLELEAQMLSNDTIPDLDRLNESINELALLVEGDILKDIAPNKRTELLSDSFYRFPIDYKQRHLFKLSTYSNSNGKNIGVAYLSGTNPRRGPERSGYSRAFFVTEVGEELKIIGAMSVALSKSDMMPVSWKKNIYNPPGLDINNLGEFISTERYHEPIDDGFSLQDYLADK